MEHLIGSTGERTSRLLQVNISYGDEPNQFVEVLPPGTQVSVITGSVNGDLIARIVRFVPGRGPYSNPLVALNHQRYPDYDEDALPAYELVMDNGDSWCEPCIRLHDGNWIIGEAPSSVSTPLPLHIRFSYPTSPCFLFVDLSLPYFPTALRAICTEQNIPFDTIAFEERHDPTALVNKMTSSRFSTVFICSFGSFGPSILNTFNNPLLRSIFTSWVHCGGVLFFQGEGCVAHIFQHWFRLPWAMGKYCREMLEVSRPSSIPETWTGDFNGDIFLKAVRLVHVAPKDRVISEDSNREHSEAAMAFTSIGLGRLGFIGDVNVADEVVNLMINLGRFILNSTEAKWSRRCALATFVSSIIDVDLAPSLPTILRDNQPPVRQAIASYL